MGKSKGYVSIWRDIQNSFLWNDKLFTVGQAWIDLIMLANHTDTEGFMNGKKVIFKRGVVYKSIL